MQDEARHPWNSPSWTPENAEESDARMPGFARAFFARLFDEFPSLKGEAGFHRWSMQPEDVYACFDGFVIQIDPDLEYIIVSGDGRIGEYGDWGGNDRTQDAIDRIRTLIGRTP